MPTYILLTKLTSESLKDLDKIKENGHRWKKKVEELCPEVEFINHYWLLGPYDFISIYNAPNEKVASKVSLISMSLGAQKAESWTAVNYADFVHDVLDMKCEE